MKTKRLFNSVLVRLLLVLSILTSPLLGSLIFAPTAQAAPPPAPQADYTTGWYSPSARSHDTGGDDNGFESNPTGAYANGGSCSGSNFSGCARSRNNGVPGDDWAGTPPDPTDRERYYNFNIASIPAGATVVGIEVRLDWRLDSTDGSNSMSVELSQNGGASYTNAQLTDSQETTSEHTVIFGEGYDEMWGATSWTSTHLNNANFRVRVSSTSSSADRDFFLDWVAVRVTYNRPPSAPDLASPTSGTPTYDTTPTLTWDAANDDDPDTLYYQISIDSPDQWTPTPPDTSTSFTTDPLGDGTHTWRVRAYDGRAYSGSSTTWNFIVDTDTPTIPGHLYEGGPNPGDDEDYYGSANYSMPIYWAAVSGSQYESGITYELQRTTNGGSSWTSIYSGDNTNFTDSINPVVDGTFIEYQVQACTNAGYCSAWRPSDGVLVDTGIPNPVGASEGYVVGTDDDWAMDNAYYVYWNTAADSGSGISYQVQRSVEGGDWETFTPSGLSCDSHPGHCWGDDPVGHSDGDTIQYRARAVTGAGNSREWPPSGSDGITIDSSDPESVVDTGSLGVPYTPPIGFNPWPGQIDGKAGDDDGSGVVQVEILIYDLNTTPYEYWGGGGWDGTASSWLTAATTTGWEFWNYGLAEGRLTDGHTYRVESRATDLAGNVQSPFVGSFMYAASAPEAPVVTSTTHLDPSTWYNDNQPSFEWDEPYTPIGIAGYSFLLDQYPGTLPDALVETTQRTYDAATTPDGEWYFHVRAVDLAGQGGATGRVMVRIDTTTPQAPADVTEGSPDVNWHVDGDIVVHWSGVPNTGSGIEYELERCVNGGLGGPSCTSGWISVTTGITGTSCNDNPGYSDDDTVYYRVRATNGVGLSGNWTTSNGMTIDSDPLDQPDWVNDDNPDIDYHSVPNGAVTVHWDTVGDTGSGITYRLERSVNSIWNPIPVAEGLTGNSHADSGSYSDDDEIVYRVTAVNGVGTEGAARESDGFTIDLDIPALPDWVREENPDVDHDDDGTFTVYWDDVPDTGSGITYRLDRSTNGTWQEGVYEGTATSYLDSASYTDGDTVRYRVTPINGAGTEGPYRLSDGIVIDLDAPQAPDWVREGVSTDPDVDYDTDGAVWVYWDGVDDTGSGITYELQKQVNDGGWSTVVSDLAVTSYDDSGTYVDDDLIEYRIIAHNGVGRSNTSLPSDGVRVDEGIPSQPTDVREADVAYDPDEDFDQDNAFFIFWTGVSTTATDDYIYYTVQRNVNGSGWNTAVSGLTVTSWDDPQAYSNGDYVAYRVTAINGAGAAGLPSDPSDGITIDTGRPNSEIQTSGYYNAANWPDQIDGAASDDYSEVDFVHITICDTNVHLCWDGDSWESESGGPYWLLTSGTTNWTYALADSELTDSHNYDLQSRATDHASNPETSVGTSSFIFASSGPQSPVISSSTHPTQTVWFNYNDPAFTWTTASSVTVSAYSYMLDQNPGTTPDTIYDTVGTSASYVDVTDGIWYFHVRAMDSATNWGPAGHYQINIDTATPNPPPEYSVTDEYPDVDYDYDGSVTVYWTAVPDTGSGIAYIVERQLTPYGGASGGWTVLSDTVQFAAYLDPATGYDDGDFIEYRVSARNGVGLTGPTEASDGFTVDSETPPVPASVTENLAAPGDEDYDPDGSVRVYWEGVSGTGSGLTYRLERRVTSGGIPGSWTLVTDNPGGNSYLDPMTHSDGDDVEYRVRAENGVGSFSDWQTSNGILIDTNIPARPEVVTEDTPDIAWSVDGSVTVFWSGVSATGSGITYRLEKSVNGGAYALVSGAGALPGDTTSHPDSGSYNDGDTVRYRVRAANGAGHVGEWRESDGMTIDNSIVPQPGWVREENPDVDYDDNGALTVYWAAVSDTGSGIEYNLERCVDGGTSGDCSDPGPDDWTSVVAGTAATDYLVGNTWDDGTEIVYRVIAVNGVGTESIPAVSDGVTVDDESPDAPTGIGEGDVTGTDQAWDQDNAFYVFWTAPADTGSDRSYDVEKSLNGSAWVAAASDVDDTDWDDPVPYSNGDTVQYRVRAVSGAGVEGAWSVTSSGITLDFVRPDSAVTTGGYFSDISWPDYIFGTASDTGSDVSIVHITIQRASDGQYWDGDSWEGTATWLEVASTTNWQYAFAPDDGETYDIQSRATDNADNIETTYGVGSFTYSESGPEAPEISSSSHPDEATWYADDDPAFDWTEPASTAGVAGYSYILDQNPGTTPDAVADTTARTRSYTDLADGVWWFHVRALDGASTWGPADHFAVHIDTATPDVPDWITEGSPDIDFDADGSFTVYWDD
ncbi:MAG: hypothetical protein DRJ03_15975, partial [Chloroflexi bacterium]